MKILRINRPRALLLPAVMLLLLIGVACGTASEEPAAPAAQEPAPQASQQQPAAPEPAQPADSGSSAKS